MIIGGGNAALCAAMTGRESGASVLLLECAPKHFRGGNSRHTRNLRYVHDKGNDHLTGPYLEDEFWNDLLQITEGKTDKQLARLTIRQSKDIGYWMERRGCRFQPSMRGTLHLDRTNAFFLGGGKGLMNAYYLRAEKIGVNISYESEACDLEIEKGKLVAVRVKSPHSDRRIETKSVVVASGGFEANIEWLKQYWGEAATNFIVRGSPYNKGKMLRVLINYGAKAVGEPKQCHAVAIDARSPRFDGGIVTRLDSIPFGITVNKFAKRFCDEGEHFWPKRYAIWGQLIARQEDQIAYSIIDSKSIDLFMPSVFPPIQANSIHELAGKLNLDSAMLEKTVFEFNKSIQTCSFDSWELDNCRTIGINPPKSHWARTIDKSPFYGYPLRPGITFTYLGVRVNNKSQIILQNGNPASNIFAAGEIMSGNILGKGYMAGFGMTIGTVFGRIAGREAADYALQCSR